MESGSETLPSSEGKKAPEAKYTAEQGLKAFEWSLSVFESTPDDKLTEPQKAYRKLIKDVKEKTIDQGRISYPNRFKDKDGNWYRQYESLPVDDLIDFLIEKSGSKELGEEDKKLYDSNISILLDRSRDYYRLKRRNTPARVKARVEQETEWIRDSGLTTGDDEDDRLKASERITKRRELIFSSRTLKPPSEITPASTEEPEAPSPDIVTTPDATAGSEASTPQPEPAIVTETSSVQEITSEQERMIDFLIVSSQGEMSLQSHRESINLQNELMRKGKFWQIWQWPRKIGIRMIGEGLRQRWKDTLMKQCVKNNATGLTFDQANKTAAELVAQREQAQHEQQAVVKHFNLQSSEDLEKIGERKVTAQGELKHALVQDIIRPVIEGTITNSDQVRKKLAEFVKSHLNDSQVMELFGPGANDFGDLAEYFATDVLEMGQQLKTKLEANGKSFDQIENYVNINLGLAKAAASTDTKTFVDRAVTWAKRRRSEALATGAKSLGVKGAVLNPFVIGIGASIATQATMRSAGYAGRAAQLTPLAIGTAAGAAVAGVRRYVELGHDIQTYRIEKVYGGQAVTQDSVERNLQNARGLGGAIGRLAARPLGAYRESDLEKYSYNLASFDQLVKGGGEDLLMPGVERKSIQDLLSLDLSDPNNRLAAVRRIAEIESRWRFSVRERVDLITYQAHEQAQQDRLRLDQGIIELRNALKQAGIAQGASQDQVVSELRESIDQTIGQYEAKFIQNKQQQDRAFQVYRLRNAVGAAGFGGAMGLVGGAASQQALKEIAEHFPQSHSLPIVGGAFKTGPTEAERLIHQAATVLGHPEVAAPPVSIETFKSLAADPNGGTAELGNHIKAIVDSNHHVSFLDETTNTPIALKNPVLLESNGHLVYSGKLDQLPPNIKSILEPLNPVDTPNHSLQEQIKHLSESGKPETITRDNLRIEINGNNISVLDVQTGQQINGSITDPQNGTFRLEGGQSQTQAIQTAHDKLKGLGFNVGDTAKTEVEILSIATKLRDFLKEGKAGHFSYNGVDFDYDPTTGEILLKSGVLELHASVNAQTGEILIDQAKNPGLDHQKLQELQTLFKKSGFGAELGQHPAEGGFSNLGPLQKDLTLGHETQIPAGTEWIRDKSDPGKFDLIIKGQPDKVLLNNAYFDADGKMKFNSAGSLLSEKSIKQIDSPSRVIETRDVLGANGEWEKFKTAIDKREWYAYNTPVSEQNELTLHTFKQGNDTVTLDMSKMKQGFQEGLKPNPIDVQKVIADKQSVFAFTIPGHGTIIVEDGADGTWDGKLSLNPNDADPSHVIKVTSQEGKVLTMPLGEFSKIVLNQQALKPLEGGDIATELSNHRDVFKLGADGKMGTIEAGRLVNQDGKKVFQSFATILGKDSAGGKIDVEVLKPGSTPVIEVPVTPSSEFLDAKPPDVQKITAYAFDSTPPRAIDFTPLAEPESPPLIPTPFSPRHPLEPLQPVPGLPEITTVYYGGESLEDARKWLKENPDYQRTYRKKKLADGTVVWLDENGEIVKRDIQRERKYIQAFLSKLEKEDPEHRRFLESLKEKMTPMSENTRVAINIPAWMEGKNIYHLLEEYTRQEDENGNEVNPELYEINIIVNRKTGTMPDNSVAEIERFKSDAQRKGKKYQINYIDVEFPEPFNNVGNARRVITNLTLLRSIERSSQKGQLYMESEDADLLHVDPKTVINVIKKLDENPYLDAVRGIQDRDPEAMMENDSLFLYRRMQDFKELLIRRSKYRPENNPRFNYSWNRIITGGWNTAYTAEAYTLIGGYNPYQTKGEDMMIGDKISMIRGEGDLPNTEVIGKVPTRSDSSPRRFIWEVASGKAAYGPDFDDPSVNAEIRNKTPEQLLDRISILSRIKEEPAKGFVQMMLNNEYEFIKSTTPSNEDAENSLRMALLYLGFKREDYELIQDDRGNPHGRIKVNSWSNVENSLNGYRTRHAVPRKPGERIGYKTEAAAPQAPPTPEPAPARPKTLVEKVNEKLIYSTESTFQYEAAPVEVTDYLKTLKLPFGARIEEVNGQIVNNQLIVSGKINAMGSNGFSAKLENDPAGGGLKVVEHQLNLNTIANLRRGQIEGYITSINEILSREIGNNINSNWQAGNLEIVNDKIRFNFKKRVFT